MSGTYQPLSREDGEGQGDVEGGIAEVARLLPGGEARVPGEGGVGDSFCSVK
eukprot:COSAG02_NODE_2215_length_9489_cov_4.810011_9_plen_52_part_00